MTDPHRKERVLRSGVPLHASQCALIALHGRGGSAEDVLGLAADLNLSNVCILAPQATDHTWYPNSFLAPLPSNEPWLSSALNTVDRLLQTCLAAGLPSHRIAFLGFSQGACLASEFVARNPQRYAALIAFTGALIGPLGSDLHHEGDLEGTPVLISSGDPDPHVPWSRVEESARVFQSMGALVKTERFPGRPHTILADEIQMGRELLTYALETSEA